MRAVQCCPCAADAADVATTDEAISSYGTHTERMENVGLSLLLTSREALQLASLHVFCFVLMIAQSWNCRNAYTILDRTRVVFVTFRFCSFFSVFFFKCSCTLCRNSPEGAMHGARQDNARFCWRPLGSWVSPNKDDDRAALPRMQLLAPPPTQPERPDALCRG